ncbi:MAG: diguanylate cyclase/phosphodiesterase with sensor, partial [Frankiales bacterium]|nr:diguanylate cyclase/phosphodiesterase with sensor [Frankiales bacterium]
APRRGAGPPLTGQPRPSCPPVGRRWPGERRQAEVLELARERRVQLFVGGLCTSAVVIGVFSALAQRHDIAPWQFLVVFALCVVADRPLLNIRSRHSQESLTWSEMAVVLGLFLVPTSLFVLAAGAGVLLFHLPRRAPLLKRLFPPACFTVGVALAGLAVLLVGGASHGELTPRRLAGLATGGMVFAIWNGACVARIVSLTQGLRFSDTWCAGLLMRSLVSLGNTAVGVVFVVLVEWSRAVLLVLPLLLVLLFAVYRGYLSTVQERDLWQQLESAARELNCLDEREIASAAVVRAAQLLKADRVELLIDPVEPTGRPVVWSGGIHGLEVSGQGYPGPLGEPTGQMLHAAPLEGPHGRIGVLRVAFDGPVSLTKRERHVLRTFAHSVSSTLQNAQLYAEMRAHAAVKEHEATHDSLTGLGNRALLHDRVGPLLRRTDAAGAQCALLIIDLDHFKEINDTLGHAAGDVFLQQVGQRIAVALPDAAAVCRLGGDEFAVLLGPLAGPQDADDIAASLLDVLAEPVAFDGLRLSIEGSVGVACYPSDASSFDELLRRADVALYQAKESRGSFAHYREDRDASSLQRLSLAAELRSALIDNELVVHLQPQFDLSTGEMVGAEALVRWQHPTRGLLQPSSFIGAVEHSGLVRDFTLAVLEKAVIECARWPLHGRPLSVAVNLSARNLLDRQLPSDVADVLDRHGLAPSRLVLEITETTMMSELEIVEDVLGRLRRMGVQLSVDDFGTGYSSLAFLQRVAVNEVKIDRSFVKGILVSDSDLALVRATVQLAHSLGARCVAEGVEAAALAVKLREIDCDFAQGFHLGRPVPAEELRRRMLTRPVVLPALRERSDERRRLRAVAQL